MVLLHPALQYEGPTVVEDIAVPLVDRAEDRRLQKAELVLYQKESHWPDALRRRALEVLHKSRRAGARPVSQPSYSSTRGDAEGFEPFAVGFEGVPADVQLQDLPFHGSVAVSVRCRWARPFHSLSFHHSAGCSVGISGCPFLRRFFGSIFASESSCVPPPPSAYQTSSLVGEPSPTPSNYPRRCERWPKDGEIS